MTKSRRNYKGKQKQRQRRYETLIQSIINPLPYLPKNIIEDILCKLPCKVVAQSKSVCKTWNSIISSPQFMDYYRKNLHQIEGNLLIFFKYKYSYEYGSEFNFSTLSPSNGNTIVDTDPLEYYLRPERVRKESVTLLGSCNGLVAILYYNKLILWNPLTKQQSFIRVEKNAVLDFQSNFRDGDLFGLCYDSSKDEYFMMVGFRYQSRPVRVYIYNFKYRSERLCLIQTGFRLLDGKLYNGNIGKVIRGLPHWVIQNCEFLNQTIVKKDIVYFNLNEVKFKKMARPGGCYDKTMLGLATLEGENQLGCVLHDIVCANLEVWAMKEYGNSESWIKVFTFPYMNMVNDGRLINHMNVVGLMPSGELIVNLNDKEFWVYDIHKGNPWEMKSRYINTALDVCLV